MIISEIIKDGFQAIMNSFREFQGSGFILVLFFMALIYIAYSSKKPVIKDLLVKYPLFVLIVFFCPVWYLYIYFFTDYEILYRILWLLPLGLVICYVLTELIFKAGEKLRPVFFVVAMIGLMISGEYTYTNEYFSLAENPYHVPQAVVDICDEIRVEGREVRAAFPDELITYVRQYTSDVCLPYGRETFMDLGSWKNELQTILAEDEIQTDRLVYLLRDAETPYLVIASDKQFNQSLSDYEFVYVTSCDGYDIYLDDNAYIGTDFSN